MDVQLRFWNKERNQFCSRDFYNTYPGKAAAKDVCEKL